MANKQVLRDIMVLAVEKALSEPTPPWWMPHVLALCYTQEFEGNPYRGDKRVLDAIVKVGDADCTQLALSDEWGHIMWMEAMALVRGELDHERAVTWERAIRRCADLIMSHCIDMDVFDGGIPNHGIWSHTFVFRAGQIFDVPEYRRMAAHAMGRVIASQTPDGCWREWQSEALFQGTAVTGYNVVSALAVNLYHEYSGDPKAAEALDRAWHWLYDFLLPDCTMPPNLDSRQAYYAAPAGPIVARWWSIPEGRYLGVRAFERLRDTMRAGDVKNFGIGFVALQYPFVEEDCEERAPSWPEYRRMVAEEACIRRRNGWAAVMSGMTNYGNSSVRIRMFTQERQDCVALAHEKTGLIIGSAHSLAEEHFSTFVFYQEGAAHYVPQAAYLASTPPLDTLLLRYGSNIGAVSVDTTKPEHCDITFSMHGERGRRPERGVGHPISAMATRAHLCLRLKFGDTIRLGERSWPIEENDEQILRLTVPAGETLSLGPYNVACLQCPWEFRWPLRTRNPYSLLAPGEWLGVAEVVLYTSVLGDPPQPGRPTATFRLKVKTD